MMTSCFKTDVLNAPIELQDTIVTRKSPKPFPKPIEVDTTRVQIGFQPSVSDWEQKDSELTE